MNKAIITVELWESNGNYLIKNFKSKISIYALYEWEFILIKYKNITVQLWKSNGNHLKKKLQK